MQAKYRGQAFKTYGKYFGILKPGSRYKGKDLYSQRWFRYQWTVAGQ